MKDSDVCNVSSFFFVPDATESDACLALWLERSALALADARARWEPREPPRRRPSRGGGGGGGARRAAPAGTVQTAPLGRGGGGGRGRRATRAEARNACERRGA